MEGPPVVEGFVRLYIESLFGWWGFGECVRDVGTIYFKILTCCYCGEQSCTCMVNAIGVGFVKYCTCPERVDPSQTHVHTT